MAVEESEWVLRGLNSFAWAAGKKLHLSYSVGEIILITIYTQYGKYGNSNPVAGAWDVGSSGPLGLGRS